MALVSSLKPKRIPVPHEPGEWLEIRPISAGEFANLNSVGLNPRQFSLAVIECIIVGWSYDAEVSPETIADLDGATFDWLDNQLLELSGLRPPEVKKSSNGNSPPTTDPEADASPKTSATSSK